MHGFPKVMGVLTHLDGFKDQKKLKKTKKALKHRFWAEIYQGVQPPLHACLYLHFPAAVAVLLAALTGVSADQQPSAGGLQAQPTTASTPQVWLPAGLTLQLAHGSWTKCFALSVRHRMHNLESCCALSLLLLTETHCPH